MLKFEEFTNYYYPESKFGGYTDVDGTLAFYLRAGCFIKVDSIVLDVGCGRGWHQNDRVVLRSRVRNFKGKCKKVIGIDVNQDAKNNPYIDEFRLINESRWPVNDLSIDVLVCDNVVEHLTDVDSFFLECRRVVKPGGIVCIKTPNSLNYISIISRLLPDKYHKKTLSKLQTLRKDSDIFPVHYKCNTRGKIRNRLIKYGFDCVVYGFESEPYYLSISKICYALGVLHQKYAPGLLKASLFAFGRKI